MRRLGMLAIAVAGLAVLAAPGTALAASSGPERVVVYSVGPTGTARTVVAAGVFNDVGTVVQGPSIPNQASPTWVFPDGTLSVQLTYTSTVEDEEAACFYTAILTGTWQITAGTGAFAGASGGGTFSGPNSHYFTRTADGCGEEYFHATVFQYEGSVTVPEPAIA